MTLPIIGNKLNFKFSPSPGARADYVARTEEVDRPSDRPS